MTQATFDDVYAEVKKLNQRVDSLEKALRELMIRVLPEKEISDEEFEELLKIEAEMDGGECITLDELVKKYRAS